MTHRLRRFAVQLFDERPPRPYSAELMKVLDGINNSGLVRLGGAGIAPNGMATGDAFSCLYDDGQIFPAAKPA
jgi:DNA polymerase V